MNYYKTHLGLSISDDEDYTDPLSGYAHSYNCFGFLPDDDIKGFYPVSLELEEPKAKIYTVDIPGADGVLDYTDALTGGAMYGNRKAELKFKYIGDRNKWREIFHYLLNTFHGKRKRIVFDEDRGGYYVGRLEVEWEAKENAAYYTISGDLDPYQYDFNRASDDWLFTPLYVGEQTEATMATGLGYIHRLKEIELPNGEWYGLNIRGGTKPQTPVVILHSGAGEVAYMPDDETTVTRPLTLGENYLDEIILRADFVELHFHATAADTVVSVDYQIARL